MWAVGACAWPQGELVQYARSNAELCGLLPTGGGRCSFFWAVDDSAPHRLRRSPFDDWRRQVVALAPAARQLVESLHGWGDLMFASYRAVFMPRVVTDRLVVIGDAAHAAGPHLGQGANLALLDATALRDATRAAPGLPAALHAYNATQWWRNAYYGLATAALMPTFQGRFPGIGWARDFALPLMQRARPMRQLMLRTLCGVW
jgi:2-polyprenyl-6-methoxyphenol hydroxylase-like FAD-dependent oxidoreductase